CTLWPISCCPLPFLWSGSTSHRAPRSFPTRRSSDLFGDHQAGAVGIQRGLQLLAGADRQRAARAEHGIERGAADLLADRALRDLDRKSTRLNSSHVKTSYAVFCLKEKMTRR